MSLTSLPQGLIPSSGEEDLVLKYHALPTLAKFHRSHAPVRGIMGPVGSGKTRGCATEALLITMDQKPMRDGVRRTRGAVMRNTYRELWSTTIPTWLRVYPERIFGKLKDSSPIVQVIRTNDGRGDIEIEVLFFPLDEAKDIRSLKSLEVTWAYLNEASEMPYEALEMITTRIPRWPPKDELGGEDPVRYGTWLDFNPPDPDHWLFKIIEEAPPAGWEFFKQPPGVVEDGGGVIVSLEGTRYSVNPHAENLVNLPSRYYQEGLQGKGDDFIRVFGKGMYGFIRAGQPVYTTYVDSLHYSPEPIPLLPGIPIELGFDFGNNTATVIAQYHKPSGQLRVIDEVYTPGWTLEDHLPKALLPHLAMNYPGYMVRGWGDPAGNQPGAATSQTCFQMLRGVGLDIHPAPLRKNEFLPRKMAVDKLLSGLAGGGKPALVIGPNCRKLHAGFLGRYRLERKQIAGDPGRKVFKDLPVKDEYSHLQDALQYLALGVQNPMQVVPVEIDSILRKTGAIILDSVVGY